MILPAEGLKAAEWFASGSASLTETFDDNIRLSATDKQSVFGTILDPKLEIRGRNPTWDANFLLDLSVKRYSDGSALDSEDPRLRVDTRYRTQLSEFGLRGEASRTSTLVSEETDSGNFAASTERDLLELSPSWIYRPTMRDSVSLGGRWTDISFGSDALTDSTTLAATAGWAREVAIADVVSLTLVVDHTETESTIDLESDLYGALVGWDHTFSERLKTSVAAGPQYFVSESPVFVGGRLQAVEDETFGYRLSANVDYLPSELTSLGLSASRQIEPSSSGSPLQRNRFEANARYQFQPRLSASLRAFFQLDDSPTGDSTGSRDRNFISVRPRLTYELAMDWDLSASYRFRTQETGTTDRAYSNAIFATITYRLPRLNFDD